MMAVDRLPGSRRGVVLCVLAACWAVTSAGAGMFSFLLTTMAVQYPAEDQMMGPADPSWIPFWLFFPAALAAVLVTYLMPFGLLPLLAAGLLRLRSWRAAAWAAAVAAGVLLEVAYLTNFGGPYVSATYTGPAVPDWPRLADTAVFLVIGGVMIWIATATGLPAARRQDTVFGGPG
jgi:hypothetical protein